MVYTTMEEKIEFLVDLLIEINHPLEKVRQDDKDLELEGKLIKAYKRRLSKQV